MAGVKHKRVALSITQKLEIVETLKTSSQTVITEKFGVGKSIVTAINKNKAKLVAFKCATIDMGMSRQAKVMRLGDSPQLDTADRLRLLQAEVQGWHSRQWANIVSGGH